MRRQTICSTAALMLAGMTLMTRSAAGDPLLMLDFGRQINAIPAETQPGFTAIEGGTADAAPPTTMIGPYSVTVAAIGAGGGFFNATNAQAAKIDASVRPLYRDYFYNNSTANGA